MHYAELQVGCTDLGGAENSQVSVTQFQKRESTDIYQLQGLVILANFVYPKLTVGAVVVLEVFYCPICRI